MLGRHPWEGGRAAQRRYQGKLMRVKGRFPAWAPRLTVVGVSNRLPRQVARGLIVESGMGKRNASQPSPSRRACVHGR